MIRSICAELHVQAVARTETQAGERDQRRALGKYGKRLRRAQPARIGAGARHAHDLGRAGVIERPTPYAEPQRLARRPLTQRGVNAAGSEPSAFALERRAVLLGVDPRARDQHRLDEVNERTKAAQERQTDARRRAAPQRALAAILAHLQLAGVRQRQPDAERTRAQIRIQRTALEERRLTGLPAVVGAACQRKDVESRCSRRAPARQPK